MTNVRHLVQSTSTPIMRKPKLRFMRLFNVPIYHIEVLICERETSINVAVQSLKYRQTKYIVTR